MRANFLILFFITKIIINPLDSLAAICLSHLLGRLGVTIEMQKVVNEQEGNWQAMAEQKV